jgi:hypothetical protein
MENKQDIGKAFKDRLGGLHREPGDAVWQNISASLQQQKRGGFRMPFWGKATSIIAGLVLVAVVTHPYWQPYMPEVIIKMPGEKDTQTVITNGNAPANAAPAQNSALPHAAAHSTAATPGSQGGNSATGSSTHHANGSNATGNTHYTNTGSTSAPHTYTTAPALNNSAKQGNATAHGTPAALQGRQGTVAAQGTNPKSAKQQKNTATGALIPGTQAGTAHNIAKTGSAGPAATTGTNSASGSTATGNPHATTANGATTVNGLATAQPQNNSASGGGAETPATPARTYGKVDKRLNNNILYSTGNYPTITKAFADSLVLLQKSLDEKKSRERSFAKPAYTLQDSLGGGNGKRSNFYVFAFIAPTNYRFGETTSVIDPSLNNHRSSAETANNFGAYVGYEFNNHFSLRTGVASIKMTNRTRNVTLGADYSGVDYANGMGNTAANVALGNTPVTLRQETSFIEVPLEATYALFGTRADLYFKGGLSMLFLGDNELYATNSNGTVLLGSLNQANDFSLAGNAGFGFYYKFLNELQLNVEPGLKYYFNTFEDANPFSLYVQAGLQYRF